MKITSYQVFPVEAPFGKDRTWTHLVLRVQTDAGIEGISYVSRTRGAAIKAVVAMTQGVLERLMADDVLATEAIAAKLFGRHAFQSIDPKTASLIDVALWDIRGKAAGQPLHRLLGGYRNRVPTYASWNIEPRAGHKGLAEDCAAHLARGFRSMKAHIGRGLSHQDALAHMRVMREAVGPDVDIMLDINQSWTAKEAIAMGRALLPYSPFWLEDLVPVEDYQAMRLVTETLETPTCGGETYTTWASFQRLIEQRAFDIVMADLDIGVTGFLKVAHMAELCGLPVVNHLATEVMAHCIAAVPNGLTVEYYPWAEWLFTEVPPVENGELVLSDRPGLGLEFDEAALKKYAL